jgi:MazG family protein
MPDGAQRFISLLEVVRELRQRCPWDREQTLANVGRFLVEEAYEAADAIAHGNAQAIADELGDVIAQFLFASTIAAEEKRTTLEGILDHAREKLVRRHPHVYGDVKADTVEQVLANWQKLKRQEKGGLADKSALAGVGRGLPGLMRAEKLGEAARRAGMDWRDVGAVLAKVREELDEAEAALKRGDEAELADEIGDMMLALGNVPRFLGLSAEETIRRACEKFVGRFEQVEKLAKERRLDLSKLTDGEIDALWNEAKAAGDAPGSRAAK